MLSLYRYGNLIIICPFIRELSLMHLDQLLFYRALFSNPRQTGAICPSSKALAKEMTSHVVLEGNGLVVELGAGTGVITHALSKVIVNPENMIVIECSNILVKNLQNRFPGHRIINGDASKLRNLLENETKQVNTIISSLPLRSLPKKVTETILREITTILSPGGRYIQLTYSFRNIPNSLHQFEKIFTKRIWNNCPPARVDVWVKKES